LGAKHLDLLHGRVNVAEILVEVSGQLYFGPPIRRREPDAEPFPFPVSPSMLSMITSADIRQRKAISYSVLPRADRFGSRVGSGGFGSLRLRRPGCHRCDRMTSVIRQSRFGSRQARRRGRSRRELVTPQL